MCPSEKVRASEALVGGQESNFTTKIPGTGPKMGLKRNSLLVFMELFCSRVTRFNAALNHSMGQ